MEDLKLLKKYKIRSTRPRREITRSVLTLKRRHFSAEDILNCLRRRKSPVSRASTFRAINLFSDKGLLRPIDLGRGFKMYELAADSAHHDHLYCLRCGVIIEFEEDRIEKLQVKVCHKEDFRPFRHTLRITGLCKKCTTRQE